MSLKQLPACILEHKNVMMLVCKTNLSDTMYEFTTLDLMYEFTTSDPMYELTTSDLMYDQLTT
jgi:hypothetical protein